MLGSLAAALRAPKAIAALGSPKAIAALGSLRALAAFGALAALGAALAVLVPGGTAPPPPGSPGDERATGSDLAATAPAAIPSGRATRFVGPSPAMLAATDAVALSSLPSFGPVQIPPPSEWHEFYFTRAAYSSGRGGWGRRRDAWATDYPKADRQFLTVLQRLTNLDAFSDQNAVWLTNENIRRYPFLYALEVGYMNLSEAEVEGLREYLTAGGFLMIDDFWGSYEWDVFEWNIKRVFPNLPIIELDTEHPVFNTFYDIDEILQVPAYGRYWGGATWERDGYTPHVRGIEDENGRLMVVINWNTDLGDAWEWAEQPDYPLQYSTFAFQMGVNMIVYAMSH